MDANAVTEGALKTGVAEIENGFVSAAYLRACRDTSPPTTSVDVLEVALNNEPHAKWIPKLDHEALTKHFATQGHGKAPKEGPILRILFLNVQRTGGGNRTVLASPGTLKFLRSHFRVSLVYLDVLGPIQWGASPGNACFNRGDRVEAMYHFNTDYSPCHVWFSHQKKSQSTTYILSNCATRARAIILHCASSRDYQSLLRPLVIDAILADSAAERHKIDIQDSRDILLQYEHHGASHLPNELVQDTFENLHTLSRNLHNLNEKLINLEETLIFILDVHKNHLSLPDPTQQIVPAHDSIDHAHSSTITSKLASNHETLNYLLSRNTFWKRWVSNYTTRTQIRINLHFNLASQTDNKTNLAIASTSKTIAQATLRDSSSMITIATMTMLFLPGTFVSAILSMSVFDNSGVDAQGKPTLKVLPQWWIFPVATVVLTGFVVGIWRVWQLQRLKRSVSAEDKMGTLNNDIARNEGGDLAADANKMNEMREKLQRRNRTLDDLESSHAVDGFDNSRPMDTFKRSRSFKTDFAERDVPGRNIRASTFKQLNRVRK